MLVLTARTKNLGWEPGKSGSRLFPTVAEAHSVGIRNRPGNNIWVSTSSRCPQAPGVHKLPVSTRSRSPQGLGLHKVLLSTSSRGKSQVRECAAMIAPPSSCDGHASVVSETDLGATSWLDHWSTDSGRLELGCGTAEASLRSGCREEKPMIPASPFWYSRDF